MEKWAVYICLSLGLFKLGAALKAYPPLSHSKRTQQRQLIVTSVLASHRVSSSQGAIHGHVSISIY